MINELYGLALDLLHQGQEEALKLAALIGKLSGGNQMSFYGDQDVKCPFYSKSDIASINCEGVENNMATKNIFRLPSGAMLKEDKDKYMCKYCNCDYEKCRVYKMLMAKYE